MAMGRYGEMSAGKAAVEALFSGYERGQAQRDRWEENNKKMLARKEEKAMRGIEVPDWEAMQSERDATDAAATKGQSGVEGGAVDETTVVRPQADDPGLVGKKKDYKQFGRNYEAALAKVDLEKDLSVDGRNKMKEQIRQARAVGASHVALQASQAYTGGNLEELQDYARKLEGIVGAPEGSFGEFTRGKVERLGADGVPTEVDAILSNGKELSPLHWQALAQVASDPMKSMELIDQLGQRSEAADAAKRAEGRAYTGLEQSQQGLEAQMTANEDLARYRTADLAVKSAQLKQAGDAETRKTTDEYFKRREASAREGMKQARDIVANNEFAADDPFYKNNPNAKAQLVAVTESMFGAEAASGKADGTEISMAGPQEMLFIADLVLKAQDPVALQELLGPQKVEELVTRRSERMGKDQNGNPATVAGPPWFFKDDQGGLGFNAIANPDGTYEVMSPQTGNTVRMNERVVHRFMDIAENGLASSKSSPDDPAAIDRGDPFQSSPDRAPQRVRLLNGGTSNVNDPMSEATSGLGYSETSDGGGKPTEGIPTGPIDNPQDAARKTQADMTARDSALVQQEHARKSEFDAFDNSLVGLKQAIGQGTTPQQAMQTAEQGIMQLAQKYGLDAQAVQVLRQQAQQVLLGGGGQPQARQGGQPQAQQGRTALPMV